MIGLSTYLCVPDIVRGKVTLDETSRIDGSTLATSTESWRCIIDEYRERIRWNFDPDACEYVWRQLLNSGKIHQPRLLHPGVMTHSISHGHWGIELPSGGMMLVSR